MNHATPLIKLFWGLTASAVTSIHAHAAPMVTEHGPFGEVNGLTEAQVNAKYPVGKGDVLEPVTGSFTSGGPKFGSSLASLNDGRLVNGQFYAENGSQVVYQLGSAMDLARIDFIMFADWQRTSAWVDVHTSTDGGATWTLLHEVRQFESNDPPSNDRQYNAHSLTDTTGTLASGINAIRFTFIGDGSADESGYAEIDVYRIAALACADTGPLAITPLPANNAQVLAIQPVGGGDVLESAATILTGNLLFGSQEKNINDGDAISNGGDTASRTNLFAVDAGSKLEFILDGTYDLDQIDVFTLGEADRTGHDYDVEVSTDGGANYTLLKSVNLPDAGGGSQYIRGVSLTDASGIMAAGISAIRFTIRGDSVFAEIDALGTLVAPPPFIINVADSGNLVIPEGSAATNANAIAVKPVGIGDILETGIQSKRLSSGNLLFGSELKNISDGLAISNGGDASATGNLFSVSNGSNLDFLLIGTFDITKIDVYTLWQPGRTGHAYTISTSTDRGKTFQPLKSVNLLDSGADDRVIRTISLTAAIGNLAEEVNAIRFTFENDGAGDPESVFAEIDVFGTLIELYSGPIIIDRNLYVEVANPLLTEAQVNAIYPVGIGDLLESAAGSITSGSGVRFGGPTESRLNDGELVAEQVYFWNDTQVTYTWGTPFDLAQIDLFMYADWQRTSAWLDVHTSTDGGSIWSLLHEVRQAESNPNGTTDRLYNVYSVTDSTGTLATGINAIRFTFIGDGSADESGYAEIDVYAVDNPKPFEIVEMTRTGNSVAFRFNSVPGRIYAVDFSNDLVVWEELDDSVVGEAGSATTGFTEQQVPEGTVNRFYRVRQ